MFVNIYYLLLKYIYYLLTAQIIAVSCAAALLLSEVREHDVGNVLKLLVHLSNRELERFQEIDLLILNYFPDTYESSFN